VSWTLSASGRLPAAVEHLEQEFVDEVHALLARFGAQFTHFQGPTVDHLTTGGTASAPAAEVAAPAPGTAAAAEVAPAKTAKAAKPAADPPAPEG
jgi:hypothetical protein